MFVAAHRIQGVNHSEVVMFLQEHPHCFDLAVMNLVNDPVLTMPDDEKPACPKADEEHDDEAHDYPGVRRRSVLFRHLPAACEDVLLVIHPFIQSFSSSSLPQLCPVGIQHTGRLCPPPCPVLPGNVTHFQLFFSFLSP